MNALDHALQPLAGLRLNRLPRATRLCLEMLDRLDGGALAVELPDGLRLRAGHGPLVAHLRVRDHAVFDEVLARGDIGFGEAWRDGRWEPEAPPGLLRLLSATRPRLQDAIYGRLFRLLGHRLQHLLRANTRSGSRRNIEAHYDLGNDFYALWLDPTMTYSAAVFASPDESLHEAQLRKYRRILGELGAQPGQTILEVGCGWGGFAEVAATEFGCKVLGITLSPSQLEFARARAERGGWADKVDFELCDYRDVRGRYDHVVSIEMIEAVGERFWPTYFAQLSALLKPGGRCVVQAINIDDPLFARYRRGTDFNIAMDPFDKLITAGTSATQLTWMDARRDGVVFTPRHGKAVEINALWISGLRRVSSLLASDDAAQAANLGDLAEAAARSFRAKFWNDAAACLFDVLTPGDSERGQATWTPDASIRPNQIFAISLPGSPLTIEQQRAVLACVRSNLLTPRGVRTLHPADSRYRGRYQGTLFDRDGAYHQGTAWPWLLGPLAEAALRIGGFTDAARHDALDILRPILETLEPGRIATTGEGGCPGHIAEIFDGDAPQRPQGCPAQAWSVAEPLRVLTMIAAEPPARA